MNSTIIKINFDGQNTNEILADFLIDLCNVTSKQLCSGDRGYWYWWLTKIGMKLKVYILKNLFKAKCFFYLSFDVYMYIWHNWKFSMLLSILKAKIIQKLFIYILSTIFIIDRQRLLSNRATKVN